VTVAARDGRQAAVAPVDPAALGDGAPIVLIGKENVRPGALVLATGGAAGGGEAPAR